MIGTPEQVQQQYVQNVINKAKNGKEGLTDLELTMANKYLESQKKLETLRQSRSQTAEQISGLQSRLQQLTAEMDIEVGRSAGFLDAMITMKFKEPTDVEKPCNCGPGDGCSKCGGQDESAEHPAQ